MNIPKLDISSIAQENLPLAISLGLAVANLGHPLVAFFLTLVPERGDELWKKFVEFKGIRNRATFTRFVRETILENIEARPELLLLPKECLLDDQSRQALREDLYAVLERAGATENYEALQIYFGIGPIYEAARKISCVPCPIVECPHNLSPRKTKRP